MLKQIKVKAPAKINLTLEVLGKRADGFHEIKSVMQAISLYDYLTVKVSDAEKTEILLSGNSNKIPYDERNLIHKAAVKFFEKTGFKARTEIYLEKNIPIEAGLAGGSTDAAAAFFALNKLFDYPLNENEIEELCASLGSDLNFCLKGGRAVCTGRGEITEKIPTTDFDVTLIKPKGFGISAKEAYAKFAETKNKTSKNNTERMTDSFCSTLIYNSLEQAVINDYQELKEIKKVLPESMMSGSGPTFFVLKKNIGVEFDPERFIIIENLVSINDGVTEC